MSHSRHKTLVRQLILAVAGAGAWLLLPGAHAADDSLCARVKIDVQQDLALERQAFEARMRITNGLPATALQQVKVAVVFSDAYGNPVLASSDPGHTEALFFIRVDRMSGIDDIGGQGTVGAGSSADIQWLIIPAPGASNGLDRGTLYFVGATLQYVVGGKEEMIEVSPDYIFVKPMPELVLDYFLPAEVYGDDAFTVEIEPPVPYTLGVRVRNAGSGVARSLAIDSAQPKIVENELGLLIGFVIEGCTVNGQPAVPSLKADFGDLPAGDAAVARWIMSCSLSGMFVDFEADFTHADEFGGELTSLLQGIETHWLVRDVLADLPGRDLVRDFLAVDGDVYRLYESNGLDTEVQDQSDVAVFGAVRAEGAIEGILEFPPTAGPVLVSIGDPFDGQKVVTRVVRSDGKSAPLDNAWVSKHRQEDLSWNYRLNLFDINSTGRYTFTVDDPSALPQPPALELVPDRSCFEREQLSFLVSASDPNGTVPTLSAEALPVGAVFVDSGDGSGLFDWTPAFGQAGEYRLTVVASDGDHESRRSCVLTVYGEEVFSLTLHTTPPLELHFGFRAGSTDGYDPGIDELADGRPTGGETTVCFVCPDPQHPELVGDFRYGASMTRWRLIVTMPEGRAETVTVAWDVGRTDTGKTMLLQRLVDESPDGAPVDMQEQSDAVVDGTSEWEICYGEPIASTLSTGRGWNLVGSPVMTTVPVASLFPGSQRDAVKLGPLWTWQQGYEALPDDQPMNAEKGYWVFTNGATVSPEVTGLRADGLAALHAGWNLISPVRDCVQPSVGRIEGAVWTWEPTREKFRALFPGEIMHAGVGYWVFCVDEGTRVSIGDASPAEQGRD